MPIVITEAPTTPCTTRKTMRDSTLQARPQRTVDTVVPSTPSTYRFRCPSRLTSQPIAGMGMTRATRYPVMTHCTVCTSVPKAVMMLGRATTTPNMPKAMVNCPGKIAVATHHLSFELPLRAGLLVCVCRLAGEALTLSEPDGPLTLQPSRLMSVFAIYLLQGTYQPLLCVPHAAYTALQNND